MVDRELDREIVRSGTLAGVLRTLEQAAVDQDRVVFADTQFMARAGTPPTAPW
jgi:hypothetical protein